MPIILDPDTDSKTHPCCPRCGASATRWNERTSGTITTGYGVCERFHIYEVRWAVVA